jgi:putative ABC transport system permease protein
MSRLAIRWRNLRHRDRVDRDLDDEVRAAFEMLVDEKTRAGLPHEEAHRAARLELGGVESVKEQVRDVRAGALFDTFLQDVRYAGRLLRRNPLFTLTAALSLAIGIGATTTIFTVTNGLLLRSAVGVTDPDRLVDIVRLETGDYGIEPISYPDLLEIRKRATTVDGVYAYQLELEQVSLRVTDSAERIFAGLVTANYFQTLGVAAAAGRLFGAGDSEQVGASPIVVLSHRFWTRRFDADPAIVGQTVRVNGYPFSVVGVAREGFRGMSVVAADVWVPMPMIAALQPESGTLRLTNRLSSSLLAGARLKPGASRAQASAEMRAIGEALGREFPIQHLLPPGTPSKPFEWSAETASPIPYGLRLPVALFLTLLMSLVSVVLVIACVNVAGILLARATARRREMAVRTAIGAGRARLVRQLLTETMMLFVLGGATGLGLARMFTSLLVGLLPAFPLPVNLSVPLDARVVAFSLGLSLVAALLSGLAPALHAAKADVVAGLKDDGQGPSDRMRLRNAFVVAQVAFSALLVVTAGVLIRGFDRVVSFDRGYDARSVDVASVNLSMAGYTDATGPQFAHGLIERVRALPGVQSATLADRTPSWFSGTPGVTVPGVTPPNGAPFFYANWTSIDPGYFATLRIPLVAGRDFSPVDRAGSEPVAIVAEAAARRFWPGKDAVGQFLLVHIGQLNAATTPPGTPVRVVGVARDLTFSSRASSQSATTPAIYVPFQQRYSSQLTILARTGGDRIIAGELRALVTSMDPNLPVLTAQRLETQQTGPAETQLRIGATVAGSVGLVGLLLAAIGIYGVTAYAVTQRTREIGIRLSLGAHRRVVVGMVLRQGMTLVAIGSAIGLILGAGAGRLLSGPPFQIPPPGVATFASAALVFAIVGLAACYAPVRRATRIRATDALRYE